MKTYKRTLGWALPIALLLGAAACNDMTTAPAAPGAPSAALLSTDTTVTTIKINPNGTDTWVIGGTHKLQIVANSVCDPALSSYGAGEWDKPCTTITQPLTVTAKSWTTLTGHPQVQFSPDIRFSPDKVNTIWLMDKSAANSLLNYSVVWCPTGSLICVDEGLLDPSVATQDDARNGFLYRRVKHLSGYTLAAE